MALKNSKEEWLAALVRAWEGRLLRYVLRFVGQQEGREIVQECFLRLWKEEALSLRGREREWLFCVCRNLAIDNIRKNSKILLIEEEGVFIPQTEELLQKNEEIAGMQAFVKVLPPMQREVIRLKFQENMSYEEIAKVTGHSTSHVGVLIHQGLSEIRRKMQRGNK